jgi:signal transduction histidine kinase
MTNNGPFLRIGFLAKWGLLVWAMWLGTPFLSGAATPDTVATRADYFWFWDHNGAPFDTAQQRLNHGLALAAKAGDAYGEISYLNSLGWLSLRYTDYVQGQRYLTRALARARATGESRRLWQTYLHIGLLETAQADHLRGLRAFEKAWAAVQRYPGASPTSKADILVRLVTAHLMVGHRAEVERLGVPVLKKFRQDRDTIAEITLRTNWATAIVQRPAMADSALKLLNPALELLRDRPATDYNRLLAEVVRMEALFYKGDCAKVMAEMPQLRRRIRQLQTPDLDMTLLRFEASCLRQRGSIAAYDTLKLAVALADSIHKMNQAEEVARQQVHFDVEEQRARIQELESQRRAARLRAERQQTRTLILLGIAAGLAALLLGAGYFYRRLQRSRAALAASEAELRQANATKDQLLAIVGHDLRGPAAAFQMTAPLMRSVLAAPNSAQEIEEILTSLDANAHEMMGLLDTLLHWARAQTGTLTPYAQQLPVEPLLREAVAPYQAQASLKKIGLAVEAASDLTVWADPDLLRTVLRNLIGNAIKFTPAGGSVRVAARRTVPAGEGPRVEFRVQDTGIGLQSALAARLLHPRDGQATSSPGTAGETGTGLGLPLSARFVALLSGQMQLIDSSVGTTLGFELPTEPE